MIRVFSIIVTYNGIKWIDKCLSSLQDSKISAEHFIVVLDNKSSDTTVEHIKNEFKDVFLIENEENLGFGQANNLGINYALDKGADFVFLLNQDAWVDNNTIDNLINSSSKEKEIGIVSPIHLNGSGDALDFNFNQLITRTSNFRYYLSEYIKKEECLFKYDYINAAAWLIKKDCLLKVGLFDDFFFHYGEDENYCMRVNFHNYTISVDFSSIAYHDREDVLNRPMTLNKYQLIMVSKIKNILCDISTKSLTSKVFEALLLLLNSLVRNSLKFRLKYVSIDVQVLFSMFTLINKAKCSVRVNKKPYTSH